MMFFKNVKLTFWANAILCVVYVKNRCPSYALRKKFPYEMWYGHIPSVNHLRIFGSTCYALIPKEHRCKLDAMNKKCIFLGYSDTAKAYQFYDEVSKKFFLFRDAIFVELSKSDNIIERHLDHLDRFHHEKIYFEFNNEIPHLEGGLYIGSIYKISL